MWKIIENAYGEANEVTADHKGNKFTTKRDALFYAQCTRCTNESPKKIAPGCYELSGQDLIEKV